MDSGAGQYEGCRPTLQNLRRQCDVRKAVWPLSEESDDATPATNRQVVPRSMEHRPGTKGLLARLDLEHGRILEHVLELLR